MNVVTLLCFFSVLSILFVAAPTYGREALAMGLSPPGFLVLGFVSQSARSCLLSEYPFWSKTDFKIFLSCF